MGVSKIIDGFKTNGKIAESFNTPPHPFNIQNIGVSQEKMVATLLMVLNALFFYLYSDVTLGVVRAL
ncbi:hypothetical protein MNV_660012 [Candidatus Methanoperedens nitroreducens]|uniref:Uncharacterized protein n=1 Tax=Candidatus Methanoperedens nitratireducens TaxID=1392998 RepID=A0A284VSL1_9EURY|nr:hypothetical protein MNV_660012 [Candidatus Methanoperedens nitroreducens]